MRKKLWLVGILNRESVVSVWFDFSGFKGLCSDSGLVLFVGLTNLNFLVEFWLVVLGIICCVCEILCSLMVSIQYLDFETIAVILADWLWFLFSGTLYYTGTWKLWRNKHMPFFDPCLFVWFIGFCSSLMYRADCACFRKGFCEPWMEIQF